MKRILPVVVAIALRAGQLEAQTPQLTLQECVKIALDNNLTVKRSVYNVETNRVNLLGAKGNFLPTLNINGSGQQNYGRSINPVTYQYFQGVTRTINPSLTGSMLLFNGLRNQLTYRQNKKYIDAADLDLEKAKNDVIITVVTNYTTVILNKELFENAKFQLNSSEQTLDRIKKQVAAGALPKTNELNQDATVATNETNLITQENNYNLSVLTLKQSMQVPASNQFEVVIPDIALSDLTINKTPEEIYAISAQTLPQVKSALLKVDAAQYAMKAARAAYYPRLSLAYAAVSNYNSASDMAQYAISSTVTVPTQVAYVGGSNAPVYANEPLQTKISDSYPVNRQLQDNLYKYVGLTLAIPILNGFQTRTGVQQAIINRELANITVKETENTLRQSIETAYNNAVAASKTYAAAVKQVNASEEAYRMTTLRFDNGAANFVEYQISANDLFSAKSTLSRSKFNFILTKKILEFYEGKTIEY
jgi:outer membrane protein